MPAVRALSFQARYRCRDTGACCTAGWPIAVEPDRLVRLQSQPSLATFVVGPDDTAPARLHVVDDRCACFDSGARRHCRIQHTLGHDALPLACRQFPRVVVHAPGVVSVVLSHYCPTAAALLESREPVSILYSPPAFPSSGEYEGLDARDALPPLISPDMAMDWSSWWRFEDLAVERLTAPGVPPDIALAQLGGVIGDLHAWRPSSGPLSAAIERAFARVRLCETRATFDVPARHAELLAAIDPELGPLARRAIAPGPPLTHDVMKRFLSAHAFANWAAYLGSGLRTWLRAIETAYAVAADTGSVRYTDLLLRHLADPPTLVRAWEDAEDRPVRRSRRVRSAGRSIRS